jgi:aryl-phospho-beta-D-glucosidase BglC (GH1 family)
LEQHLALARKYGLRVILQMLIVEGAQFVPTKGEAFDYRIWVQPELQERFLKFWEAIAQRYKDEPQIVGYSIFAEPVASGTRQQWIDLANKTVARIRKIDNHHIIFVQRLYGEFGTRREMAGLDLAPERAFFVVPTRTWFINFIFSSATNTRINTHRGGKIAISAFIILIPDSRSSIVRRSTTAAAFSDWTGTT